MAKFDIEGARKAGYSDDEIRQFLLQSQGAKDAKAAGYSDDEILGHFGLGAPAASATPAAAEQTPQGQSVLGEAGRVAGIVGGGLAQGAAAGLALPNTLQSLVNRGYRAGAGALGLPIGSEQDVVAAQQSGPLGAINEAIQPPSNATMQGLVEPISGPTPQGVGERYLSAAAKGVGASLVPGGGGLSLGNMAVGAAAGLGSQAGEDIAPGTIIGPVIGGLIGGGAVGAAQSIGQKIAAASAAKSAQQGLAGAEQGAQDAGDVVTNLTRQQQELVTAKQEMNLAHKQNLDTLQSAAGDAAEQAASGLGTSTTLQQSGKVLQDSAQNWLDNTFPKMKEKIWKPVDDLIPSDTPAPLFGFKSALDNINENAGSTQALTNMLTPNLPRKMASVIEDWTSPAGTAGKEAQMGPSAILDASGNPIMKEVAPAEAAQPVTWADARRLRTVIGDAMTNPALIKDIGEQNIAHMYAALTGDLEGAAKQVSPEAAQAFQQANQQTSDLFDVARGPISSIVNAKDPESAANSLIASGKRGATDMAVLREQLPDAVNEVGATALRSGKWQQLSPEAQEQLITDPAVRKMLSDSYGAIDAAQQAHSAAEQAHAQSVIDLGNQQNAARAAQDAAKIEQRVAKGKLAGVQEESAKQTARWSPYGPLGLGMTGAGLGAVGEHLGNVIGNPFGYQGAGALGAALGLGLPVAGMMAANPVVRGTGILGAIRGSELNNPLLPQK